MPTPIFSANNIHSCIKSLVLEKNIQNGVKQSLLSQIKDFILNLLNNGNFGEVHDDEFQGKKAAIADAELGILKAILEAELILDHLYNCTFCVSGQEFRLSAYDNTEISITNTASAEETILRGVSFPDLKRAAIINMSTKHINHDGESVSIAANADLTHVNLSGLNLSHFDFSNTKLRNTDFTNSNLTHCNFSKALLHRTKFEDAFLAHSNFTGARIDQVTFYVFRCANTKFSTAHLPDVTFDGSIVFEENILYKTYKSLRTNYGNMYLKGFKVDANNEEIKEKIEVRITKKVIKEENRQFVEPDFASSNLTQCRFLDTTIKKGNFTAINGWKNNEFTGVELNNCLIDQNFEVKFNTYSADRQKFANKIAFTF